jgi:hypothetical protein
MHHRRSGPSSHARRYRRHGGQRRTRRSLRARPVVQQPRVERERGLEGRVGRLDDRVAVRDSRSHSSRRADGDHDALCPPRDRRLLARRGRGEASAEVGRERVLDDESRLRLRREGHASSRGNERLDTDGLRRDREPFLAAGPNAEQRHRHRRDGRGAVDPTRLELARRSLCLGLERQSSRCSTAASISAGVRSPDSGLGGGLASPDYRARRHSFDKRGHATT